MQYKKPNEGGLQVSLSQLSGAEVSLLFGVLWGPMSINYLARNRSADSLDGRSSWRLRS
jgi:hypothetical protein